MKKARKDIHNSDVPRLCQSCEARHKGMCGALSTEELIAFARHTRVVRHEAGDILLHEKGPIETYGNVMHGVVKLTKTLADGRQQIVGLQFAPDFVGRLRARESPVRAEASSDVEVCRISSPALQRFIAGKPAVEARLLEQALRDIDEAQEWMLALGRKTAQEKVASFLAMMAHHIDPLAERDGILGFELPLTRAEIADFLGLTIGTVSREFSRLKRDGVIEIASHRNVRIIDRRALRQQSG
jgi:CRP/FNR family transcriptional regulator